MCGSRLLACSGRFDCSGLLVCEELCASSGLLACSERFDSRVCWSVRSCAATRACASARRGWAVLGESVLNSSTARIGPNLETPGCRRPKSERSSVLGTLTFWSHARPSSCVHAAPQGQPLPSARQIWTTQKMLRRRTPLQGSPQDLTSRCRSKAGSGPIKRCP